MPPSPRRPGRRRRPAPRGPCREILPALPPALQSVAERMEFSFADCIRHPNEYPGELSAWVGRMFLTFRDLELRWQMADFAAMFRARVSRL